jgi:hypothetical protein
MLFAGPARFAFLQEGREPFARVFGAERFAERVAKEGERVFEREIALRGERAQAEANRGRRPAREIRAECIDFAVERFGRDDLADDPDALRLRGLELLTAQHHLDEGAARNDASEHRRDHERKEPDVDFGRAELGVALRDREMRSRYDAEPAAHRGPVHARHDRLFVSRHREHQVDVVALRRQRILVAGAARHLREVAARAERLPFSCDHDDANRRIFRRISEGPEKLVHHLRPDRVAPLRVVQSDPRDRSVVRYADLSVRPQPAKRRYAVFDHDAACLATEISGLN